MSNVGGLLEINYFSFNYLAQQLLHINIFGFRLNTIFQFFSVIPSHPENFSVFLTAPVIDYS